MHTETYDNASSLARAGAEAFASLASRAAAARGRFTVALAGGSTPRATYALLASDEFASSVCWQKTVIFWGDERCVPPTHRQSNYATARRALLDRVPIPGGQIHRMRGELPPEQAAADYRSTLRAALGTGSRLDLVLLGMGAEGHTASLFPGTTALKERERTAVAVYVEALQAWRVTLTLPALNAARHVLFLVSGKGKARAPARLLAGEALPAALVQPLSGNLTWLIDRDAASTPG
ncbi:MAG: 6-phosphogluconolactonase [Anaerolineae bacterium]|nr:6-phosphogluconolactonase [Anaerolineae bacterium]